MDDPSYDSTSAVELQRINTYGGQGYGAFEKNETVQQEDSSDNESPQHEGGDVSKRSSSKDKTSRKVKKSRSKEKTTKTIVNELVEKKKSTPKKQEAIEIIEHAKEEVPIFNNNLKFVS